MINSNANISDSMVEEILLAYLKNNKNIKVTVLSNSISGDHGDVILKFTYTNRWVNSSLFSSLNMTDKEN